MKKLAVAIGATLIVSCAAWSESLPLWSDLAIGLGGAEQKKVSHILSLGTVAAAGNVPNMEPPPGSTVWGGPAVEHMVASTMTIDLTVRNTSDHNHVVCLEPVGSRLKVAFVLNGADTRCGTLRHGTTNVLRITFNNNADLPQDLNAFWITANELPVAEILLDYVVAPEYVTAPFNSGNLPSSGSGVANWKDLHYEIATGPAPPLYSVYRAAYWLTGDRKCNEWSTCEWGTVDSSDVVFRFALQGHSENAIGVRESEGHLLVVYHARTSNPTLK